MTYPNIPQRGFTLVEMAMVMLIIGLLLSGLIPTISIQVEQQRTNETNQKLTETKEAMLGFAVANGRLPCPASANSNGMESFCTNASGSCTETTTPQTHGRCANSYNGFAPAATLGIGPVNEQGYLLDGWNNAIRYAVAGNTVNSVAYPFTSNNGMQNATMDKISASSTELLYICASATGSSNCVTTSNKLTDKVPALVFSTGKNGGYGGTGLDEAANLDGNRVFVSHTPTPGTATNGEFDDLMLWVSPNILFNRMVAAGKLP